MVLPLSSTDRPIQKPQADIIALRIAPASIPILSAYTGKVQRLCAAAKTRGFPASLFSACGVLTPALRSSTPLACSRCLFHPAPLYSTPAFLFRNLPDQQYHPLLSSPTNRPGRRSEAVFTMFCNAFFFVPGALAREGQCSSCGTVRNIAFVEGQRLCHGVHLCLCLRLESQPFSLAFLLDTLAPPPLSWIFSAMDHAAPGLGRRW